MNWKNLIDIAADSGGILYLMALLLLVVLTVILERSRYLHRLMRAGERLTRSVEAMPVLDAEHLATLVSESQGLPHAAVINIPVRHDEIRDAGMLRELMEEAIMLEIPKVDRNLWVVDTIITLAPLLGLLGTIIGMFGAFQVLGHSGAAPVHVTGGVAEALIATACGLFIAILGLVGFNTLNQRVRIILHQLETISRIVGNRAHLSAVSSGIVSTAGPVVSPARPPLFGID